jgi:hypothetical protein
VRGWRGCWGRSWKERRGAPGKGEARGGDDWAEWWPEEAGAREVWQLDLWTKACSGSAGGEWDISRALVEQRLVVAVLGAA